MILQVKPVIPINSNQSTIDENKYKMTFKTLFFFLFFFIGRIILLVVLIVCNTFSLGTKIGYHYM